jgi:hypothetical protein
MPYASSFLRLQVFGTAYVDEEWSWSLSFDHSGAAPTEVSMDVRNAVQGFHTGTWIHSTAKLTGIKLNEINTEGKYANPVTVQHDFATPVAGGGSTNLFPPQIAAAVTLRTDRRRGPGSTGRFYIPNPAFALQADGRMNTSNAEALANAAGTMANALQTALGGAPLIVASQGGSGVPPAHVPVTRIDVGRVFDTQRRRRRDLPEDHVPGSTFAST